MNDPMGTGQRRLYLHWKSLAWPHARFSSATFSHGNIISTCHYQISKLNHQINTRVLFSPSWCLAPSALTWHILPTTLSFGTLQILLPALANLANVLPFLFLSIGDSFPPSKSNLLQMKSLHTSCLNPNFPIISESLPSGLPHSSNYLVSWTNFSAPLRIIISLFVPHSIFFSLVHLTNTLSETLSTVEVAQEGHFRLG